MRAAVADYKATIGVGLNFHSNFTLLAPKYRILNISVATEV